jgi:hypothetical protein
MRSSVLFLLTLSIGCGGGCSGTDTQTTSTPTPTATPVSGHEVTPPLPEPSTPPDLVVAGVVDSGRQVTLRIENHGTENVRLANHAAVEQEQSGRFGPFENQQLSLRMSCSQEAPECIELAPGATLEPPAWFGTRGDFQCACERCVPAPAASYRFVVTSCDGAHRVEGEPFALP